MNWIGGGASIRVGRIDYEDRHHPKSSVPGVNTTVDLIRYALEHYNEKFRPEVAARLNRF